MNVLLEIRKDTDIVKKTPPADQVIEAFENETGYGPELNPMQLCFNVPVTHCWNIDLAEQFIQQFMRQHEIEKSEEPLLYELFTNRFGSLKRRYNEWRIEMGEDTVQRTQRVKEKHRRTRKMQRRDTRRNRVSKLNY